MAEGGPYMEIAYGDIVENIQKTVLPDVGYVEGPTHTCAGQMAVRPFTFTPVLWENALRLPQRIC
ncbi:MAG: hypothetical protein ACLTXL_06920 [Clostridia bacterium]